MYVVLTTDLIQNREFVYGTFPTREAAEEFVREQHLDIEQFRSKVYFLNSPK